MNFNPMIDIDDCEPSVIPYEDDLIFAMQNLREHLRFHTKMLKKDQRKGGISAADAMRVVAWVEHWQNEITAAANAIKQAEEKAARIKAKREQE